MFKKILEDRKKKKDHKPSGSVTRSSNSNPVVWDTVQTMTDWAASSSSSHSHSSHSHDSHCSYDSGGSDSGSCD